MRRNLTGGVRVSVRVVKLTKVDGRSSVLYPNHNPNPTHQISVIFRLRDRVKVRVTFMVSVRVGLRHVRT